MLIIASISSVDPEFIDWLKLYDVSEISAELYMIFISVAVGCIGVEFTVRAIKGYSLL